MTLTKLEGAGGPGVLAGQPVDYVITDPSGDVTRVPAVTDDNGQASATFTPTQRGVYELGAAFNGNMSDAPSSAGGRQLPVYQAVDLQVDPTPTTTVAGAQVVMLATLVAIPGGPLQGQDVAFSVPGGDPTDPNGCSAVATDARGVARCTVTYKTAGLHLATASFSNPGDFFTDHLDSYPPAAEVESGSVAISPVDTALSAPVVTSGPAYVGAAVTVSATLSGFAGGGVAGETVDFAITDPSGGVTDVSSAPTDDNGVASATFTPTQKGVYDVVASFAGDASDASSTSTAVSTSVYQKVQLSVPSVNAVAGVGTAVSATLLTVPGGKPVPDEQVEISPGGSQPPRSVFTDANGVASSKVTYATSGSFTAQAQFSDAADFFANSDGSLEPAEVASGPVEVAAPTTVSAPIVTSGTAYVGADVTVSATLSEVGGGGLSGQDVVFAITDPSGHLVTPTTAPATTGDDGQASATFTPTQRGVYDVVASFAGDASDASSTSTDLSISVYQKVKLSVPNVNTIAGVATQVSATLLTVPGGKPVLGQSISFSLDGSDDSACTASTDPHGVASCTVTYETPGPYTAHASFNGPLGDFFANADGTLPAVQSVQAPVTVSLQTTQLGSSANPAVVGQQVTYTATVSPVPDRGTVAFKDNGAAITACATQPVNTTTGKATCQVTYTGPGTHPITATYSDNSPTYPGSVSPALSEVVNKAGTATSLASSPNPAVATQPVMLTAAVTPAPAGGTVAFDNGNAAIAGCATVSVNTTTGIASCQTSALPVGSDQITAIYSGDPNYHGSTSSALTEKVIADTPQNLGNLTLQYVPSSAKYQALPRAAQKLIDALANQAIASLANIVSHITPAQQAKLVTAYQQGVAGLKTQGWLTSDQASTLNGLASNVHA